MKMTFDRDALAVALGVVVGATDRRPIPPTLSYIRLETAAGTARLSATDLEIAWTAEVPVTGADAVDQALPGKKFLDVVKAAPKDSNIDMEIEPGKAVLRFGRSRISLATLPGYDCPELSPDGEPQWIEIPAMSLRWLIETTSPAQAQEDVRHYLRATLFDIAGGLFRAVATDGHRLSTNAVEISGVPDAKVIVPRKAVQELRRNLNDDDSMIGIGIEENQVTFRVGGYTLVSKCIPGMYPDYAKVIPQEHPYTLTVDKEAMKQALNRIAIVANQKTRHVRLVLSGGDVKVCSERTEMDSGEETIAGDYDGPDFEAGFTSTYLTDALSSIRSETVRIKLKDGNAAALMTEEPSDFARHIVMPVRS